MAKLSEKGQLAAKAAEMLRTARNHISPKTRWVQGSYIRNNGEACAIGAVGKAMGMNYWGSNSANKVDADPVARTALSSLATAINPHANWNGAHENLSFEYWADHIHRFNDGPSTKHHDVLAAFDLAIEQQCKIVQQEATEDGDGADPAK